MLFNMNFALESEPKIKVVRVGLRAGSKKAKLKIEIVT